MIDSRNVRIISEAGRTIRYRKVASRDGTGTGRLLRHGISPASAPRDSVDAKKLNSQGTSIIVYMQMSTAPMRL